MTNTANKTEIEKIDEYENEMYGAVRYAEIKPNTEMISQVYGDMLANHADTAHRVPKHLLGCVDAIYVHGLILLHRIAFEAEDCDPDLRHMISMKIDNQREQMRERAAQQDVMA